MNTQAAVAEPPPSAPSPPSNPNPVPFAEAVKANDKFFADKKAAAAAPLTTKPPTPPPDNKQQPPANKDTAPPVKKDAPPAAKDQTKPDARGLSAIKPKEEPAKKDTTPPPDAKETLTPEQKQQKAWEEYKGFKEKYADLPAKHELTTKELEALRAEKASWESKSKAFEKWEQERDMRDFTQSNDYKVKVAEPFAKIQDSAWHIAVAAVTKEGAPAEQTEAMAEPLARNLMKALNNPNPILRERQIRAILEQADNPIPDGVLAGFIGKGEQIQDLNREFTEMEKNARLRLAEHENITKAEKMQADAEARQILDKAYDGVKDVLLVNAKDVITEEMINHAREEYGKLEADIKPLDTAFANLSHGLVPQLIQLNRDLRAELDAIKEERDAMMTSRPGINPSGDQPQQRPENVPLAQAIRDHKEGGYHF